MGNIKTNHEDDLKGGRDRERWREGGREGGREGERERERARDLKVRHITLAHRQAWYIADGLVYFGSYQEIT